MPADLQKGDKLTADWLRVQTREIRRNAVTAGHGLRETQTPNGKVISLAPQPQPAQRAQQGYPYGERWNFGIEFHGDDTITVHPGLLYHAGAVYGMSAKQTVTGLITQDMVCIVYNYTSNTASVGVHEPYCDHDGQIIRALCRVEVSDSGSASLARWYGGGIEIGMIGQ